MDPFSIAVSTITVLEALGSAFRIIKEIKDLPHAIQKVGESLPIVLDIVELARDEIRKGCADDTVRASITKLLEDCNKNAEKLKEIFGEIQKEKQRSEDEDWPAFVKFYREKVRPLGKAGKVEALMEQILENLKMLAVRHIFKINAEARTEVQRLNEAIKALEDVDPSLPDSDFNDNSAAQQYISGNGKGILSTGSHAQNTMGNSFTSSGSGAMHFEYHNVYYTMASNQQSSFSLLEWLKCTSEPLDFEKVQIEKYRIAQSTPNSGKWFLESQEFKKWQSLKTKSFWCYGKAGTGKTILTSIIVNHLFNRFPVKSGMACVYVYFDREDRQDQDLTKIISNLLVQLIRRRGEDWGRDQDSRQFLTDQRLNRGDEGLLGLLEELINNFVNVFLIVDALDQCVDTQTMRRFINLCNNLPQRVRILFTSQQTDLEPIIRPETKVEIKTNQDDVHSYLRQFIQSRQPLHDIVEQGQQKDSKYLQNALNKLTSMSHGVFLLAHLHIVSLAATVRDLDELNQMLSTQKTLTPSDESYRKATKRIQHNELWIYPATRALTWVLHAESPLTVEELSHAVAISDAAAYTSSENRPLPRAFEVDCSGQAIIDSCAGAVITALDENGRMIARLAHNIPEQDLKNWNNPDFLNYAQAMMAEACLRCLTNVSMMEDRSGMVNKVKDDTEYPFLGYAANHWGHHLSKISEEESGLDSLAWNYLCDYPRLNCMIHLVRDYSRESGISGSHMAAHFGLERFIRKAGDRERILDINALTTRGETPLHWAVAQRKHDFMAMLIEKKADLNIPNIENRTALHKAVMINDQIAIAKLLPHGLAHLEHEDSMGYTCLRWAARYGQTDTVIMLLEHGAQVDSCDQDGFTALRWAAIERHIPIIKTLIARGAAHTTNKWQLLSWAAKGGETDVIQLLADHKMEINAFDFEGTTALNVAIDCNQAMASWTLIQNRADINKPDATGRRPLHVSTERCCKSSGITNRTALNILWLLLENDADVNGTTSSGDISPLHLACRGGNISTIRILLQYGADPRRADRNGRTPLHIVCADGNASAVRMLLQHEADPKQVDEASRTPLHDAVIGEHKEIINILLQQGGEIVHAADYEKRTPLHHAASQGSVDVVETLLGHGACIDAECCRRRTPLYLAVMQQHTDVVNCLLKRGANTQIATIEGKYAIDMALEMEDEAIVQALCQAGSHHVATTQQVYQDTRYRKYRSPTVEDMGDEGDIQAIREVDLRPMAATQQLFQDPQYRNYHSPTVEDG